MSRGLDVLTSYMYPPNLGVATFLSLSLAFLACCLAIFNFRHIFANQYKNFRTRLKITLSCPPSIDVPHHGLRTYVDCEIAFPQSYMIFSAIMLLPSFLSLLRSWQSISQFANLLLHFEFWFLMTDFLISAIFVARVILHRFNNPPERFTTDGVFYYKENRRSYFRAFSKLFLVFLFTTAFGNIHPFDAIPRHQASQTTLPDALSQYKTRIEAQLQLLQAEQKAQDEIEDHFTALHAAATPRKVDFDPEAFDLVIDNCASRNITPFASDCTNVRPYHGPHLIGVAPATVTEIGHVRWTITSDAGEDVTIDDPACLICPSAPSRILSVNHWAKLRNDKRTDSLKDNAGVFSTDGQSHLWWDRFKQRTTITHRNMANIPILRATLSTNHYAAFTACFPCYNAEVESSNEDDDYHTRLTRRSKRDKAPTAPSQTSRKVSFSTQRTPTVTPPAPPSSTDEELLMAEHLKLGHLPFDVLQSAAKQGVLPSRIANCTIPKCPGCLFSKAKRKAWRHNKDTNPVYKLVTKPGECVSMDHLMSSTPGLIGQGVGKLTTNRYTCATVFVDHYTGLDFVYPQESTTALETIDAKRAFERFAAQHGITVRHYHADNGVFASKAFRKEVQQTPNQTISFCGVNAHHQNGVAERRIRDLSDSARAMLIEARHRNPFVTSNLWPYALRQASIIRRSIPRKGRTKSPLELFSRVNVRPKIRHFHQFGCPTYVLTAPLQAGHSQPRWDERARVGVYLGHSPMHASSVALILSPRTGLVSPQFHCVFDDNFETIRDPARFSSIWQKKFGRDPSGDAATASYGNTRVPANLTPPWFLRDDDDSDNDSSHSSAAEGEIATDIYNQQLDNGQPLNAPPLNPIQDLPVDEFPAQDDETDDAGPDDSTDIPLPFDEEAPPLPENEGADATADEGAEGAQPPTNRPSSHRERGAPPTFKTRSGRTVKVSDTFLDSRERNAGSINPGYKTNIAMVLFAAVSRLMLPDMTFNEIHPMAYAASVADNDTMNFSAAMKQPDKAEFIEAMEKEISDHVGRKHWQIYTRQQMRDTGYKGRVIMAIWSFKRKRNPFGVITKYKARLCAHGGQTEKGIHYEESYSPVVSWPTVRLMLTLAHVFDWKTRQIDFVLAYPQADIKTDVFMEVPNKFEVGKSGQLFRNEGAPAPKDQPHVLKLEKNVYGLKDAGLTWYEHLTKGLKVRGFVQSLVDPCLFYKGNLLLITYVDDCVIICPDDAKIDEFILSMQRDYNLTDEGDISAFLGINIARDAKGIHMTQPALIERIISTIPLKDSRMHDTPADKILYKDVGGQERKTDFHYRSAIGQLNYLCGSTRPELQVAVHQCARFSADPKLSHEQAVKRIVRYLKRTKDRGMILKPDKTRGLECHVDADFAGGFSPQYSEDASACLSRTGYVLWYAGCPLLWASKMQTTIALSTTEAEYMALSAALRDVIYVTQLLDELRSHEVGILPEDALIKCKVFEDNVGALEMAKTPKLRPRTKHIAIQYHHFREYVKTKRVTIQHVGTNEQVADIFTKPLPRPQFEYLRKRLCGW
jgi:hypothetical protein